jgi:hypothetical protein
MLVVMRTVAGFCILIIVSGCEIFESDTIPVCDPLSPRPQLRIVSVTESTQCNPPNGTMLLEAKSGKPPFRYYLENELQNFEGKFDGLHAGEYRVSVTDANGCSGFLNVLVSEVSLMNASATTSPDDKCFSNSGKIVVTPKQGRAPFQYKLEDELWQNDSIFYLLNRGIYKVSVRDTNGCNYQFYTRIEHGFTGVSYSRDIQPILSKNCNTSGCHNGDAGASLNFTNFNNVRWYGAILINYASRQHRQPPILQQEIDYIRCWVEDGKLNN